MTTSGNNQVDSYPKSQKGRVIDSEIGSVTVESDMDCGSTIVPGTGGLGDSAALPVLEEAHGSGLSNLKAAESSKVRIYDELDDTASRSSKRKRDENIPDGNNNADSKRTKGDDQPKTKIMLVNRVRELTMEDLEELLRNLYPRHDKMLAKPTVPRFNGRGVNSGRIWFDCADIAGRKWLEKQIKSVTDSWSRGSLDVLDWVAAPPLNRILLSVPWLTNECRLIKLFLV
ncbi:uncharacterized protein LOC134206000 [Armigeres subalbatus]|uniref:uncharacterized protein LOC134206000 n=1 Tax=Armigeres subalbatus TaxID=124917 RepID=UPI002ED1E9EC